MSSAWEQPVFLIGPQRTGSTLVGRILAALPGAAFTVNGKILYHLLHWVREGAIREDERAHLRVDEIVYALRRKPILGVGKNFVEEVAAPALEELARALADSPILTRDRQEVVRDAMRRVYSRLNSSPTLWGDKYNEYVLSLDEIRELFPQGRFVATSRKAEAAGRSMLKAFSERAWCPSDLSGAIRKHQVWSDRWRIFADSLPEKQKFVVNYERLVSDPAYELQALAGFLDLADDAFQSAVEWIRSEPSEPIAAAV